MALNGLICAEVPLRNYSLTHSTFLLSFVAGIIYQFRNISNITGNISLWFHVIICV